MEIIMKFEINLDAADLWRFSMYHANRGLQGIFNLLFTCAAVLCLIFARDVLTGGYIALLVLCALIFSVWQPLLLYVKSKKQAKTEGIRETLYLEFTDDIVKVSQADRQQEFLWDRISKIVRTKHMIIIYTDRIHAYLLPAAAVGDRMEDFCGLVRRHLPKERWKGL